MIQKSTFQFLKELKKNNNRPWFDKNKPHYEEAKKNIETLIEGFLVKFSATDKRYAKLNAKDCVFRIYRDIRFSPDKTPYKTHLGAGISPGGKKMNEAGYYVHIEPGKVFLAGGMWMPPTDQIKMIRQEIAYNTKKFKKIISDNAFKKYYGGLDDEYKLMRPPKGYDKSQPDVELLMYNSYIAWHGYNDKVATSKNFAAELNKGAKIMKPLIDFLDVAVSV